MPVLDGVRGIRKTSPSGGDLHPTEVYVLAQAVDGLDCGVYHYNVEHHRLDLVRDLPGNEVSDLIVKLLAGQYWFSDAHALFVMTSRFGRNYWKYRHHPLAYRVLHLDVGHLSQSLYLVSTLLGLGVFLPAAINHLNVEEMLNVDADQEAAIAIAGCGPPGEESAEVAFRFEGYSIPDPEA
jgi:SagB-type dehydrogenase family enzyme